jgi:CRISPR-associated endonuclease Csn1
MKKILGLDLGTNSIGWALVEQDFENKQGKILGMGSRIIPMAMDILGEFEKGNSISQTAERTGFRGIRRIRERHLLRRERLHRVLNIFGILPEHYASQIDFEKRLGQFKEEKEPKLAYNNNDFVFKKSFTEMLDDFKKSQPELLNRKNRKGENAKIPYDWTIYYLRKKALTQKIDKEELAWLILNFNQKRGYYQLRGEEEEETPNKLVEFYSLKIIDVIPDDEKNKKGEIWYSLNLENGWVYRRSSKISLTDWKDKVRDFIVTTDLNDNGSIKTDKDGNPKRSFRAPSDDDWTLLKKKTEQEIDKSEKTVGTFIYDTLLKRPNQKIRGKLVRTIERRYYKEELKAILKKQIELQPKLFTENLYNDCVRELYRNNESHQLTLNKRDFIHLFVDDIIFYQRPLKSKKSSIGNCTLEFRKYKTKDKDAKVTEKVDYLKAIPKSHPLYQEFRVWQWLNNLRILKRDDDTDITSEFIKNIEDQEKLFSFLMGKKEVNHLDILKYLLEPKNLKPKEFKKEILKYRWNYVFDESIEKEEDKSKKYPCNETGYEIRRRLEKVTNVSDNFLTSGIEEHLWHIIYSVTDKNEFEKALTSFAHKHELDGDTFVENFKKFPPYKSEYGAFSEKAIKKLLPLMRLKKYWNFDKIDFKTKERIEKIITGEYDDKIKNKVREKAIHLTQNAQFQGLPLWLAQYIVYDRHSEAAFAGKWRTVSDLENYLNEFKQHSLRNPIVEQVIAETLRVVKDIWLHYGKGAENFFDEIHIELGREMKNPAEDRKRISSQVTDNENTNLRIKALIAELKENSDGKLKVDDVRPYSPSQQEALRIYEEGVLNSSLEIPDDIAKISKTAQPSKVELIRYKLWLEQKYRSPYTGEIIPLGRLFTEAYQIEHIIPQSRYFDDSLSNKVICEAAVNQLKDNQLGLEFIKNHHGEKVETGFGNTVEIFTEEIYRQFINEHYVKNRSKKIKLLLDEIPDKMIERQLNDTRYISKFISNLLSNIVRSEKDDDGVNSKNIIPGNGKITNTLKQDWGFNDVWNDLILPRFERMNQLTISKDFTIWNENHHKYLPSVPMGLAKGFQRKRIDHRHHALDALVIACATRDHINLLNNKHAKSNERFDLNRKLRKYEKVQYLDRSTNKKIEREVPKDFIKPWNTITTDVKNELEKIIVSFKQNLRVINKTNNKYEKYVEKNGKTVKELVDQTKGDNWAIRKPLHKETVSGEVKLDRIQVPKGKILTATRKNIDTTFDLKTIESITDTGIQKILKNYLASKGNNPELAFSPEGLEEMNKDIARYNDGIFHQPIYKSRIFELGSKFPLGKTGNKKDKYVEAAKGTNLFFAIYWDEEKQERKYETIPLNEVIEYQKQVATLLKEEKSSINFNSEKGKLLFVLSPNDLVYVPAEDEKEYINGIDFENLSNEQVKRIYKMVSSSGSHCFFIRQDIATSIVNKNEFSTSNKMEKSTDGEMIKVNCIKLSIDRLGNIDKAIK